MNGLLSDLIAQDKEIGVRDWLTALWFEGRDSTWITDDRLDRRQWEDIAQFARDLGWHAQIIDGRLRVTRPVRES